MSISNNKGDTYITVVPYCPLSSGNQLNKIIVRRLCFWFNNTFDHQVNDDSIEKFLLQVKLFGAIVYPDFPEKGCYAIDADDLLSSAGRAVSEIHYKGQVIYCRS